MDKGILKMRLIGVILLKTGLNLIKMSDDYCHYHTQKLSRRNEPTVVLYKQSLDINGDSNKIINSIFNDSLLFQDGIKIQFLLSIDTIEKYVYFISHSF